MTHVVQALKMLVGLAYRKVVDGRMMGWASMNGLK
jgi:hypothetical protein